MLDNEFHRVKTSFMLKQKFQSIEAWRQSPWPIICFWNIYYSICINLKRTAFTVIIAASIICQGQIYGIDGKILGSHGHPDEVGVLTYGVGNSSSSVEWYVSTNVLAMQPRWDGVSAEIPLSIRNACLLALPHVTNEIPQVRSWAVESVLLRNPDNAGGAFADVWCYVIQFTPRKPEILETIEDDKRLCMMQIVLLDGTVLRSRKVSPTVFVK